MHFDDRSDEPIKGASGEAYLLPNMIGTLRPADRALDFARFQALHESVVDEAQLIATIIEMHERERLTVLMDLLNRPVKVKIEETQVAPV